MARKTTKSTKKAAPGIDGLIEAAFARFAVDGWRQTKFADVVADAGMKPAEALTHADGKADILRAYIRGIDAAVLGAEGGYTDEDTPRDRLFDLLMRRFEAMMPRRDALARVGREIQGDPLAAAFFAPGAKRAMRRYLDAAGIEARGPFGGLRSDGLLMVWLATHRVWADDDSADLAKTMAALDKNLSRAETAAGWLKRIERGARRLPCPSSRRAKRDDSLAEGDGAVPETA